jgi:hypothetical protein
MNARWLVREGCPPSRYLSVRREHISTKTVPFLVLLASLLRSAMLRLDGEPAAATCRRYVLKIHHSRLVGCGRSAFHQKRSIQSQLQSPYQPRLRTSSAFNLNTDRYETATSSR